MADPLEDESRWLALAEQKQGRQPDGDPAKDFVQEVKRLQLAKFTEELREAELRRRKAELEYEQTKIAFDCWKKRLAKGGVA